MRQFVLFDMQWNRWNGFYFELVRIEIGNFDRALLGFWTNWENHICIDFLFIHFETEDKS
jgi:hypothetical protein